MSARGAGRPAGSHVLDRMVADRQLDPRQRDRALAHAERMRMRAEDALVDVGAVDEESFLRYLASSYRTRFVGTRKLARASIDSATLQMVPPKAAEQLAVCPVLYDPGSGVLSVVAADLGAGDLVKEVQMVSRARQVRVLVAMPAAVDAAIRKHYRGEAYAFARLEGPPAVAPPVAVPIAPPRPAPVGASVPAPEPPALPSPPPPPPADPAPPEAGPTTSGAGGSPGVPWGDYLESLNVLVALHEQGRGELRGHTATVARLCRKVGQRLGVTEPSLRSILVAAYLHDVGKASAYHLTGFNVALYEGHRVQAEKSHQTPIRLFDLVQLPEATVQALTRMYERVDGNGFPGGLRGKDIPVGGRMLAVLESYADLTGNSKNPYRRVLSPKEACDALDEHRDSVFDGAVLDALRYEVLGDEMRARLLADRRKVLVVEPDSEESTVLEMRLMEHGHEVHIARTTGEAVERLGQGDIDAVISEVDVPPDGGFSLTTTLGDGTPLLFLTRRGDRESIDRAFQSGAVDYLVKPASAEVVVAKTEQALEGARRQRGGRGVTGSLAEMALPDVVQVLANGRKSGRLVLRSGSLRGEVYFGDGEIHDALFGDKEGEEAFYHLLRLEEGEFELDPGVAPRRRTIHQPPEMLLLEGMRRLDEGTLG